MYYIIYPSGDKSKLKDMDIEYYELYEYAVASRKHFEGYDEAEQYAKELAGKHNKEYLSSREDAGYLD